jgi:CheY-like chemotaxis protein
MTTCYAKSFKELRVYQKAREVSQTVFRFSKGFPKEEMYSLTDQIRRSARSVGAQIAEAGVRVPVVVITGHDTTESRERALAGGASAYLRKPVDDQALLEAIDQAVNPTSR